MDGFNKPFYCRAGEIYFIIICAVPDNVQANYKLHLIHHALLYASYPLFFKRLDAIDAADAIRRRS